jgi:putative hydrolase
MHIEVDSHSHTIASGHAYSTLSENIAAAAAAGITLLASTEHGPAMPGSPHIWYFVNMRVIPRVIDGVTVLRGIEANILDEQGTLDIDDSLHGQLDLVLGALHEPVIRPSTALAHTRAIVAAMTSGRIDILAHGGNPAFPVDIEAIASTAAACNVLIEINNSSFTTSRSGSAKNCAALAEAVARHGGRLTFGSDAHIACNIGKFAQCLQLVREVGFPTERIVAGSRDAFLAFLAERGKAVALP